MDFNDRHEAGRLLAQQLLHYSGQPAVILALPRGGLPVAEEIARTLHAPLDLLLAHKIGHPLQPEYAIAAIAEGGQLLANERELAQVDHRWFEGEKARQLQELKSKRERYLPGSHMPELRNKVAIVVDDGIATGLTMRAGLLQLREQKPHKIVVAVPVAPAATADTIGADVYEFVCLHTPSDYAFRGAIGAYYADFSQVDDAEAIEILKRYGKEHAKKATGLR